MLMVTVIAGLDLWRDLKAAGVTEQQVRSAIDSVENGAPPEALPGGLKQFLHSPATGDRRTMLAGACVPAATTVIVWALMKERQAKGG